MRMGDGESLLYKTLDRALRLADGGTVLTVTGRDYYFLTRDEYSRHANADLDKLPFLLEPVGRNTAPAVVLAALYALEHCSADATLLVLPADHLIADLNAFAADVQRAARIAADGWLVTFGIQPNAPETGFGYIRMGADVPNCEGREVEAFVEKPDRETAETYLASGNYTWNSGDYAIMERAERVAVVPARFDWSDIGSWKAISDLGAETDAAGNQILGEAIVVESENCYIQAGTRMVAAVGVSNLVIVDTGDAVLVADRERSQQVKVVVEQLRASNHQAASVHNTVHRPWGSYTILEDRDDCKVKRLTVKPGHVLSLQLHNRRSEHWTVVDGTAKVRIGEREFLLQANESAYIPMNTVHRLENPTAQDIHLIEVQCGDYFGEDDIVRLEDRYGRVPR
jgi:mannose-1-phosphate guanylyltransferase/mannose-6-phosphate isomerase